MKGDRKVRIKEIENEIRDILFDEWDPIGINDSGPRDEYDNYIGRVYRFLNEGKDVEFLAKHLLNLEVGSMHCTTTEAHRKMVARRLLDIDVTLPRR